eukprot:6778739-Pyramimonas_sp.AAC.2
MPAASPPTTERSKTAVMRLSLAPAPVRALSKQARVSTSCPCPRCRARPSLPACSFRSLPAHGFPLRAFGGTPRGLLGASRGESWNPLGGFLRFAET